MVAYGKIRTFTSIAVVDTVARRRVTEYARTTWSHVLSLELEDKAQHEAVQEAVRLHEKWAEEDAKDIGKLEDVYPGCYYGEMARKIFDWKMADWDRDAVDVFDNVEKSEEITSGVCSLLETISQ